MKTENEKLYECAECHMKYREKELADLPAGRQEVPGMMLCAPQLQPRYHQIRSSGGRKSMKKGRV